MNSSAGQGEKGGNICCLGTYQACDFGVLLIVPKFSHLKWRSS